jgi:acetyl-CoA acetyltransferase
MSRRWAGNRTQVAIAGYAVSEVTRRSTRPIGAVAVETALAAITDAGLQKDDVDGFTTGAILPSAGGHAAVDGVSIVSATWLAEQLGIRPRWCSGFQGYGQLSGSVMLAANAVASGAADYVLVHRALANPPGRYHENPMVEAHGAAQWTAPHGLWGPPAQIALPYMEYMQRYGATREEMATVVVELRANGSKRPWSYWHDKPITVEDYMEARIVADPISILDCDIPVDAVAAFILTTAERARDLPNNPVYLGGFGQGSPTAASKSAVWTLDEIMEGGAAAAKGLWESSGLGPGDVDLPQLYDGFSPFIYLWLEVLGYCPVGEAHLFVQNGAIETGKGLPVASGGGAIGNGRLHGLPQMLECYTQLARRAGGNQLDVNVGLACHSSPHYGGVMLYSTEPLSS